MFCVVSFACGSALANSEASRKWFEGLPADTRYALQQGLLLLGYYDGFVDGEFGPATYSGLAKYEDATMAEPTGVLTTSAMDAIEQGGAKVLENWGIELYSDQVSGSSLPLPTRLLTSRSTDPAGTIFTSSNEGLVLRTLKLTLGVGGFRSLYSDLLPPPSEISYKVYREGWFIISSQNDEGDTFYSLFVADGRNAVGFSLKWTTLNSDVGRRLALLIASYFSVAEVPAPSEAEREVASTPTPQPSTPPVGRPVEDEQFGAFIVFKDEPTVIGLNGEIGTSSPLEFRRALKARPGATVIALNSPGGLVDSALVMAHDIRELGLATYVGQGQVCYSACAFLFLAGTSRVAVGELGVHQIWNDANDLVSGQNKLSDVIEALDEFAVNREVLTIMLRTPPDKMHVFTSSELARLGLNTLSPPMASIEPRSEPKTVKPRTATVRTIAVTAPTTGTVFNLLVMNGVTATDATIVASVFKSDFNVSIVPAGVRATIIVSAPESGNVSLLSVDLDGLPQTYQVKAGRAAVGKKGDSFVAAVAR